MSAHPVLGPGNMAQTLHNYAAWEVLHQLS